MKTFLTLLLVLAASVAFSAPPSGIVNFTCHDEINLWFDPHIACVYTWELPLDPNQYDMERWVSRSGGDFVRWSTVPAGRGSGTDAEFSVQTEAGSQTEFRLANRLTHETTTWDVYGYYSPTNEQPPDPGTILIWNGTKWELRRVPFWWRSTFRVR